MASDEAEAIEYWNNRVKPKLNLNEQGDRMTEKIDKDDYDCFDGYVSALEDRLEEYNKTMGFMKAEIHKLNASRIYWKSHWMRSCSEQHGTAPEEEGIE
jgi:membrane-bound lytic murein transglycosylase MltF